MSQGFPAPQRNHIPEYTGLYSGFHIHILHLIEGIFSWLLAVFT